MVVRVTSSRRPRVARMASMPPRAPVGMMKRRPRCFGHSGCKSLEELGVGEGAGADDEQVFAGGEDFFGVGLDGGGGGTLDDHFQRSGAERNSSMSVKVGTEPSSCWAKCRRRRRPCRRGQRVGRRRPVLRRPGWRFRCLWRRSRLSRSWSIRPRLQGCGVGRPGGVLQPFGL